MTDPATAAAPSPAGEHDRELHERSVRLLPELISLRRAIHAEPELGSTLPHTQQRVLDAIADLPLEVTLGRELSSVVAVLRGAHPGPTVLLRGDMDALPILEESGETFAAVNGRMHACGHDLHTAGLVGAARLLAAEREQLHGAVVFMFQPAEELGTGAAQMIEEGVLDASGELPVAAYGVHVVPGEGGVFSTRGGTLMAGAIEGSVTFRGRGGHGANPQDALDPVPAVAELTLALNAWANRRFSVQDPVVLSVTQLSTTSSAVNIIPEQAGLGLTCRVLSVETQERVLAELPRVVAGIAAAHGLDVVDRVELNVPVTVNDGPLAEAALATLVRSFGTERVRETPQPVMGSEDFSHVAARVPSVFFYLRTSPADAEPEAPGNHSPQVRFDDAWLGDQALALATLALRHLRPDSDSADDES